MYFFVSISWNASSASTLDGTRAMDPLRPESYRMEGEITAEGLWLQGGFIWKGAGGGIGRGSGR